MPTQKNEKNPRFRHDNAVPLSIPQQADAQFTGRSSSNHPRRRAPAIKRWANVKRRGCELRDRIERRTKVDEPEPFRLARSCMQIAIVERALIDTCELPDA